VFVVFAGDVNGAAEYDLDIVQDCESSYVVCALGDPRVATCNAISILSKGGRAQLISISDGDGVRLFLRSVK